MIDVQQAVFRIIRNKTFRNGIFFTLFSFLNSGISFLIMMLMACFILPEAYGQLSLFTTLVSLLTIFICLNTNIMVGINFFRKPKDTVSRYLNVSVITAIVVYLLLITILMLLKVQLEAWLGLNSVFLFFAISICLLQLFSTILLDIWRLEEKVGRYGIYSMLTVVSNLILTVLFVAHMKLDWQGRVYAMVLTCLFFALVSLVTLVKKGYLKRSLPQKEYFVESYKFGLPLIPHGTTVWLRQGLDRYIINFFYVQSAVGFFSFAYNFANIINIVGAAFNASYSVNIYKTLSATNSNTLTVLKRNCRYLIVVYILICVAVCMGTSILIPFIFPKYNGCVDYLLPLCIGAMFHCFYLVYVNILFFYKKTKVLMYITFTCSLLHCIASFLLTKYGVIYTAYVSLFSNMMIFIGVYWYSKNILRNCFPLIDKKEEENKISNLIS